MTEQEEKILYNRCLTGNRVAQFKLYNHYKGRAYSVCLRYASDRQIAQDYLQEGFIMVFRDLHQYDALKGQFWPWMRKVIINACLQHLRKKQKIRFEQLSGKDFPIHQDVVNYGAELSSAGLLGYLQKLPGGYRAVFNLHVLEGYSHPEIAGILDISINTSKSQLSKAKKYLRSSILKVTKIPIRTKLERTA